MTALQKLVPASERTAFNTEVLGMEEAHAAGYVPEELLTKVRTEERRLLDKVERVYVAIDPASHRRSSMGLAAVCFGASGEYVLLGVASIQCSRPQLVQVQLLVKTFLKKLRAVAELATAVITPIVECNGAWPARLPARPPARPRASDPAALIQARRFTVQALWRFSRVSRRSTTPLPRKRCGGVSAPVPPRGADSSPTLGILCPRPHPFRPPRPTWRRTSACLRRTAARSGA
jgi:hypothetical protein